MTKVTVYDPAMCCSTGICGVELDQNLVDFAADLDWLKSQGTEVVRINLSQEPALFADNSQVKMVLDGAGTEGLPVIIVDDSMQSFGRYPDRGELAQMVGVDHAGATTPGKTTAGSSCCDDAGNEQTKASSGCCDDSGNEQTKTSSGCC
ncbi:MAG: arsenite efflux transporter metallochaperone ArsD [SAR324 cluster bacterium]|nr:arsenite efflux transporter metallochaperone ArsD [SAR324 cluster bacterium]MBL7034485.1 arsenite efflux transporter metallochaperone ArsD [SAR324 cluster bacterium]